MENRQSNLRIPRRAITQWERVKVKLTTRILARGQEADGPTIFCEACGLLDAVLGGSGIIAEEGAPVYEADDRLNLARALAARPKTNVDLARAMTNVPNVDLALVLRKIADRLETGDGASE